MALMTDRDVVYVSRRGRRFHEGPECRALAAGHMIFACRCGDPYCGCAADTVPVPQEISIGDAAFRDLDPCAVCYPDFGRIASQLPSDSHFGHVPLRDDTEFMGEMSDEPPVCARCTVLQRFYACVITGYDELRKPIFEDYPITIPKPVTWPCISASVLGLTFPQESIS